MQDIQKQIDQLKQKIVDLEQFVATKKRQQISFPIDDASRVTMGLGIIGNKSTSATTASGYVTVSSNIGPIRILIV